MAGHLPLFTKKGYIIDFEELSMAGRARLISEITGSVKRHHIDIKNTPDFKIVNESLVCDEYGKHTCRIKKLSSDRLIKGEDGHSRPGVTPDTVVDISFVSDSDLRPAFGVYLVGTFEVHFVAETGVVGQIYYVA